MFQTYTKQNTKSEIKTLVKSYDHLFIGVADLLIILGNPAYPYLVGAHTHTHHLEGTPLVDISTFMTPPSIITLGFHINIKGGYDFI